MGLNLSRKGQKEVQEVSNANQEGPIYQAFVNGLNEMGKEGVDRVILTLYESEPKEVRGWIKSDRANYYPFEMLDKKEQEMIMGKKHYTVVALVGDMVGNVVKYKDKGVEVSHRTHIIPLLPKLKPESKFNYVTEIVIYTGENLKEFAKSLEGSDWTPKIIEQNFKAGIEEYRAKTTEFMERGGIYQTLERMEKRRYSPSEQLFADIRNNIASAREK